MGSIIWTETASNDIEDIRKYISRDSVFYANQFIKKLIDSTLKLEKFPQIGKPLRELPQSGYKEIIYKKYRIIYRIDKEHIYVLAVHHSARLLSNNDFFREVIGE